MQKLLFTGLFLSTCVLVMAQFSPPIPQNSQEEEAMVLAYIGGSTGINSYTGLIGLYAEIPLPSPHWTAQASFGLGAWGFKYGLNARYYWKQHAKGHSFGLGYVLATGADNIELQTVNGLDTIIKVVDLQPAGALHFDYTYYFRLGESFKCGVGLGYAMETSNLPWRQVSGPPLEFSDVQILQILQPGGLIAHLNVGFDLVTYR